MKSTPVVLPVTGEGPPDSGGSATSSDAGGSSPSSGEGGGSFLCGGSPEVETGAGGGVVGIAWTMGAPAQLACSSMYCVTCRSALKWPSCVWSDLTWRSWFSLSVLCSSLILSLSAVFSSLELTIAIFARFKLVSVLASLVRSILTCLMFSWFCSLDPLHSIAFLSSRSCALRTMPFSVSTASFAMNGSDNGAPPLDFKLATFRGTLDRRLASRCMTSGGGFTAATAASKPIARAPSFRAWLYVTPVSPLRMSSMTGSTARRKSAACASARQASCEPDERRSRRRLWKVTADTAGRPQKSAAKPMHTSCACAAIATLPGGTGGPTR
mmetsp:Transcript_38161/g.105170  ORF Transcript_38161/g.105170 Transcript_38161/m.105170 type:complete len:326 (+) Transcript_38161:2397-3374(+)